MAKILLNDNVDGSDIVIEDSLLLKAYTVDSVTNVLYLEEEDGFRKTAKVSETLANVGATSDLLFSTTIADGTTVWLNRDRVNDVFEVNSKATIVFDASGSKTENIKTDVTAIAVKAAIISKEGDFAYDIDSFTNGPDTIVLDAGAGDVTAKFTSGVVFTVFGEGDANDSIYSVVSSAFGTETTITVNETPALVQASTGGKVWVQA
jgi:hypothetical protein